MPKVDNDTLEDNITAGKRDAEEKMRAAKQRQKAADVVLRRTEKVIEESRAYNDAISLRLADNQLFIDSSATNQYRLIITADDNTLTLFRTGGPGSLSLDALINANLQDDDDISLCLFHRKLGEYLAYYESGIEPPA